MGSAVRRRGRGGAKALLASLAMVLVGVVPAQADAPDQHGAWDPPLAWPVLPIHAALTPAGHVLTFGSEGELRNNALRYDVWDPVTGTHLTLDNRTETDIFCALQVVDPITDRVLTAGGDGPLPRIPQGVGPNVTLYDDADGSLTLAGAMHTPRWYPTGTVLTDGRLLVQGGAEIRHAEPDEDGHPRYEGATPVEVRTADGAWRVLEGIDGTDLYTGPGDRWRYPRAWLDPRGNVFTVTADRMFTLDASGDGDVTMHQPFDGPNTRASSTAVMFRPGQVLQVGGGQVGPYRRDVLGAREASIIDITAEEPVVEAATPMAVGRHWADATVLPDGTVLVTGGSTTNNAHEGVAYAPELWDPDTDTWTRLAPNATPRLYHSFALLLPDATVLVGGGGSPGPADHLDAEVFRPPYLFDRDGPARRPEILDAPSEALYGEAVEVAVTPDVERFTLVGASAVTHSFDNGQRFMELAATGTGAARTVTLPATPSDAPPGTYLLFALDDDGTPSVAALIELDPPAPVHDSGFEGGRTLDPGERLRLGWGARNGPWEVKRPAWRVRAVDHGGLGDDGHHLDLGRRGKVVAQLEGLDVGTTYQVTLRMARNAALAPGTSWGVVKVAGEMAKLRASTPSTEPWDHVALRFTAGSEQELLEIAGTASPRWNLGVMVDDVVVRAVS